MYLVKNSYVSWVFLWKFVYFFMYFTVLFRKFVCWARHCSISTVSIIRSRVGADGVIFCSKKARKKYPQIEEFRYLICLLLSSFFPHRPPYLTPFSIPLPPFPSLPYPSSFSWFHHQIDTWRRIQTLVFSSSRFPFLCLPSPARVGNRSKAPDKKKKPGQKPSRQKPPDSNPL